MLFETLEALKKSIKHWERMHDDPYDSADSPCASECALCEMFAYREEADHEHCSGCPVYERTGTVDCFGTPYCTCISLLKKLRTMDPLEDDDVIEAAEEEWKIASGKMLGFLKSLLPKERCNRCDDPLHDGEIKAGICGFCQEINACGKTSVKE